MKEHQFINTIKTVLSSDYIGDDCAYLKDVGIVISQDNLVEDVHFSLKYIAAYDLGYKSAMVNLSDIAASGAEPKYMTVGLSLPSQTDNDFITDFYKGLKVACKDVEIVGGDITGSDKIFVSIAVIGLTEKRQISSRSNAKVGYKVVVSGNHGSSAAGLYDLQNGKKSKFTRIHLMPQAQLEFSKYVAQNIKTDYAMMDTSDGLCDALNQISVSSGVKLSVNFDKIPYDKDITVYKNYKDLILYGGEDYQLVACVPKNFDVPFSYEIGTVEDGEGVEIDGVLVENIEEKLFNHFG